MNKIISNIKSFAKENWIMIVIALVVVISFIVILRRQNAVNKEEVDNLLRANKQVQEQYKSENGLLHSRVQEVELDRDNIKAAFKSTLDSLNKELGIKDNKIQDYRSMTLTVQTAAPGVPIDTNGTFHYQNPNWSIGGHLDPLNNAINFDNIKYTTNISMASYYKGGGLFTKSKLYVDVWTEDTTAIISNLRTFRVKEKVRWITFGPQIGVTYSFKNKMVTPYIGLGATLNVLSL